MKNKLLAITATAVLATGLSAVGEVGKPEAFVAPTVPVVNKELEMRLYDAPAGVKEVPFVVTSEGKEVFRGKALPDEEKISAKWTPQETGFYTATFDLKGKGGKVSWEFPVIWREHYFTIWGPPSAEEIPKLKYILSHTVVTGGMEDPYFKEAIPMLKKRGAKLIYWVGGSQNVPPGPMSEEAINALAKGWSGPLKKGYDGIFIDEFGEWPAPESIEKLKGIHKALVKLREENPDAIIMPTNGGALLREESAMYKYADCVALLETYPTLFSTIFNTHSVRRHIDHRIETARSTDLLNYGNARHTAVILWGPQCDTPHEEPIEPETEMYIRYIKKTAPEMRGIAFYGGRYGTLIETEDRLICDYYIKPVVDIRAVRFSNYSPRLGEKLDILAEIHNLGGMTAKRIKAKVYAARLGEGKKELVGQINIEKIGCGIKQIKYKGPEKPEFQEINGNRYALFSDLTPVFLARTTRKLTWTPATAGYYSIIVEIQPSEQHTILDGALETLILVK